MRRSSICCSRSSTTNTRRKVMTACGVDLDELRNTVAHYLDTELEALKVEAATDPSPTSGFQRVVQRAILHVQSSGRDEVTGANVLVALFSERESYAVYFLQQQDMSRLDAVSFISHGVGKGGRRPRPARPRAPRKRRRPSPRPSRGKGESALKQFTVDLNEKAKAGKVDPLIGRGPEVDRTIQILCRRSKNNPLYVGRSRRRQDRDRRRPGAQDRRGRRARSAAGRGDLFARHGRAARRHALSRRFRGAAEASRQRAREAARRGPVHRRDPHRDRRRRDQRRRDGRVEPAQAGAVGRRDPLHRLDHLQGIPQPLREGPRAAAALPEDRRQRADGRGHDQDPRGPAHRRSRSTTRSSTRPTRSSRRSSSARATSTTASCPTRRST